MFTLRLGRMSVADISQTISIAYLFGFSMEELLRNITLQTTSLYIFAVKMVTGFF